MMATMKTWGELADDELRKETEIDTLRAELATMTRQRDQWERNAFEALATIERTRAELAAVTAERDAWRNDSEERADALEASRAERNHWVRKAAALEAERDALRAKVEAVPVEAIRAMYAELKPADWHPAYTDVADWLNTLP